MVDTGVYVAARTLLDRLVLELAATRAGTVCTAVVHPGQMTPDYGWCDEECDGAAWTRVMMIAPTTTFPQILSTPVQPGRHVQLAVTIELGVDRCYMTPEDNSMPPIGVLDSATRDALDDAAAMHRAVMCAGLGEFVVGSWTPRGPMGAIHGGTLPVTVLVDTCACGSIMPALDSIVPKMAEDPSAT
ncbi:hypothetical protein AB0H58_31325 [Nocardia neocaledoniensis]|uniref:hypothetical protein n=1 Tax=Nocardia neocaledoniensis TaxID=236511 RepID=UPI0033F66129